MTLAVKNRVGHYSANRKVGVDVVASNTPFGPPKHIFTIMWIIADTHAHLYREYDFRLFFQVALTAFEARVHEIAGTKLLNNDWRGVLCLVERTGQHFFQDLRDGTTRIPDHQITMSQDPLILKVTQTGKRTLYLLAGRQIVAREGIEVLALGMAEEVQDGTPALDIIKTIRKHGGLPVLPWALGKWMFERGQVLRKLLESGSADEFAVGDTSLRPREWPMPCPLRIAKTRGFALLAGSDPLPPPREVVHVGQYVTTVQGAWEETAPFQSILTALSSNTSYIGWAGSRSSGCEVLRRVVAHWVLKIKHEKH